MANPHAFSRDLLMKWDVRGLADTDVDPDQAYLHQANQVLALLRAGADMPVIAGYLIEEASNLGAPPDRDRDRAAAFSCWAYWQLVSP